MQRCAVDAARRTREKALGLVVADLEGLGGQTKMRALRRRSVSRLEISAAVSIVSAYLAARGCGNHWLTGGRILFELTDAFIDFDESFEALVLL